MKATRDTRLHKKKEETGDSLQMTSQVDKNQGRKLKENIFEAYK